MKDKLVFQTWTDLLVWAQDRDRWQALVNDVMKLWVPENGASWEPVSLSRTPLTGASKYAI
jgi:hypothetical protein